MHDAERREAQAAYQAQRRASVQQRSHDVERFVAAMNAAGNPGALLLPEPEPRTRRFTSMRFDRRPGWAVAERSLDAVFRAAPALVSTTGLVYADTEDLKVAGQRIVYLTNPHVGHLGIFVSAQVARLEHRAILESLGEIEALPPGLYEMKIEGPTGQADPVFDPTALGDLLALDTRNPGTFARLAGRFLDTTPELIARICGESPASCHITSLVGTHPLARETLAVALRAFLSTIPAQTSA